MARKRRSIHSTTCKVCRHPDRALIEATRVAGASLDKVAARYAISRDSLKRHMANHVTDDVKAQHLAHAPLAELAERAAAESLSLLQYLAITRSLLMQETQLAASVHDRHGLSAVSGRLLETLKQIGTLTGEIQRLSPSHLTVNNTALFIQSPAFAALHEMLIKQLQGYPDALAAVLEGLREIEARAVNSGPPMPVPMPVLTLPAIQGGAA